MITNEGQMELKEAPFVLLEFRTKKQDKRHFSERRQIRKKNKKI